MSPPRLPPLDAESPLRAALDRYVNRVALVSMVTFIGGALLALLLGCIAALSGTQLLTIPIGIVGLVFCLSLPILLLALLLSAFVKPRSFPFADRWLAQTIAALRAGETGALEQLLIWGNQHPEIVRAALRKAYSPELLAALLPAVQHPNPAYRYTARALLELERPEVLPALLPLLQGRQRNGSVKRRIRLRHSYEAAFIAAYVLGPLRTWDGPPQPPPDPNLLYTLLVHWPELASDADLRKALAMPDFAREARWLDGKGNLIERQSPLAFTAVRRIAAEILERRQSPGPRTP